MQRRNFRERVDVLGTYSDAELIERYRFDREGILFLEDKLNGVLTPNTNRNQSFSSVHKILTTLRYLASGHIQLNAGDLNGMSQPSVSRCISQTLDALCQPEFASQVIAFPLLRDRINLTKADFFGMASFPNVVGVIDCTHVQIKAPSIDEPAYVNRMGYHSINTQVVFDSQGLLIDLVARWPGSTHDSRVLRESGLWTLMERGLLGGGDNYLLGDSGYPCKRWLLTPYLRPQLGSQVAFNRAHKSTRSLVERCIGQLKRIWGILQGEIRLQPAKVCKVIMACGVLYNICKVRHIPLPDPDVPLMLNEQDDFPDIIAPPQEGLRYRDYVCNTYF